MYDEVSKMLKEWKRKSKMTISEISQKSGIPEPTLTKLFAGQTKNPTLPTVAKLVHLFGYTLDDLERALSAEPEEDNSFSVQTETATFGKRLAVARKQKGLTQKDLAAMLIVTPTCLNYWENGKRFPSVSKLRQLSEVLNVDGDYLLGRNEPPESEQKEIPSAPAATGTERISIEETDKLLAALGFIEEGEQLSDDDLLFLQSVVGLLDAWFKRKRK